MSKRISKPVCTLVLALPLCAATSVDEIPISAGWNGSFDLRYIAGAIDRQPVGYDSQTGELIRLLDHTTDFWGQGGDALAAENGWYGGYEEHHFPDNVDKRPLIYNRWVSYVPWARNMWQGIVLDFSIDLNAVGYVTTRNNTVEAVAWPAGGFVLHLGDIPGGDFNSAAGAVAGSTIVGYGSETADGRRVAVYWSNYQGPFLLPHLNEYENSYALAVSRDERVIGGRSQLFNQWRPVLWIAGEIYELATPGVSGEVRGISADGRVVCGFGDTDLRWREALIWRDGEPVLIRDLVPRRDARDWWFFECTAVSDDGTKVLVNAQHVDGHYAALVVTL